MKLYFAHNFMYRKEFRIIEKRLEKELKIELLNPFYDEPTRIDEMVYLDKNYRSSKERIAEFENKFNNSQEKAEEIVRRDLKNLASCDGLLTFIETPSIGTTMEIVNARIMCKPIYVISKHYACHPWIKTYATKTFKTLKEFRDYIKNIKKS